MLDPVDLLLEELVTAGRGRWPTPRELTVHRDVRTWRAFLESDREALKTAAGWPSDRDYKIDPLPALIADAWADHLFGEDVTVEPANEADAGALDLLLEANGDLTGNLHSAERQVIAEGEQWWRVYADRDVADAPLLEWHGRDSVVPLYVGRRLLAVALVTELEPPARSKAVWRHFEVHVDGAVEHVLFKGTKQRIGQTVPLESHAELRELAGALAGEPMTTDRRVWEHGLPMLMGPATNGRTYDRRTNRGVSDFARIADHLLDLNEATTIGAENARLTAKRRIVVPESVVSPRGPELVDRGDGTFDRVARGELDLGADVLVAGRLDAELGDNGDGPFKVLEYAFDAQALITYKRDLLETALTRVGLTPRYVGVTTGEAPGVLSGTAYKLTLIPTTKAGNGKRRPWAGLLPKVLGLMARLDALPAEQGGFGRTWRDAITEPAVELPNPMPSDAVEDAQVEATLVGAGVRSIFTSVQTQHPDWSEELVEAEVERIREDKAQGTGTGLPGFA